MVLFTLPMSIRVLAQAVPSISVSPASGPSGSSVSVSGSGFYPNGTITVSFGSTAVATLKTDVRGTFSGGFTVPPNVAPGVYNVTAFQPQGTDFSPSASTRFTVLLRRT